MSHGRVEWRVRKVPKKFHVLFEWPQMTSHNLSLNRADSTIAKIRENNADVQNRPTKLDSNDMSASLRIFTVLVLKTLQISQPQ